MVIFIMVLAILSGAFFGWEEGIRYNLQYNNLKDPDRKIESKWHNISMVSRLLTLIWGMTLGIIFVFNLHVIVLSILSVVIYWIISDGIQNIVKGRHFFAISKLDGISGSTSITEKIASWYVKVLAAIVLVILLFII